MLLRLLPVGSPRVDPGVARLGFTPAGVTVDIDATAVLPADGAVGA